MPDLPFQVWETSVAIVPETGALIWKRTRGKAIKGNTATFLAPNGYLMIKLTYNGVRYCAMAHRIVWLLSTGDYPKYDIDHLNCNKADNRIENLVDVPVRLNIARKRQANRELPRGVTYAPQLNKLNPYMVQCGGVYGGYFATVADAKAAYDSLFHKIYGELQCRM